MKNFTQTKSRHLKETGEVEQINLGSFSYLLFYTATNEFEFSFDGEAFSAANQGLNFGPFTPEKTLFLRSKNRLACDVVFYAGNFPVIDARLSIIHDANQFLNVAPKIFPTYIVCSNQNLGAGATMQVVGGNAGHQRKDMVITNLSQNGDVLSVQGAVGAAGAVVFPMDNLPLETSDTVVLKNEGANPIPVMVLETYYQQ